MYVSGKIISRSQIWIFVSVAGFQQDAGAGKAYRRKPYLAKEMERCKSDLYYHAKANRDCLVAE